MCSRLKLITLEHRRQIHYIYLILYYTFTLHNPMSWLSCLRSILSAINKAYALWLRCAKLFTFSEWLWCKSKWAEGGAPTHSYLSVADHKMTFSKDINMNAHVNESLWPQAAPATTQNLMGAAKFMLSLSVVRKKLKLKGE